MAARLNNILQFKIELAEISPKIWRRIQVPVGYSFWDLHVAIQDSMGWLDYHLHGFKVSDPDTGKNFRVGIPGEYYDELDDVEAGWDLKISKYFISSNQKMTYYYDFGDDWIHQITFEGRMEKEENAKYPKCIGGERSCPPEDCGGPDGYYDMLKIISDPAHEDHEEMIEWLGGSYDPEYFRFENIRFDNPRKRWKKAFLNE